MLDYTPKIHSHLCSRLFFMELILLVTPRSIYKIKSSEKSESELEAARLVIIWYVPRCNDDLNSYWKPKQIFGGTAASPSHERTPFKQPVFSVLQGQLIFILQVGHIWALLHVESVLKNNIQTCFVMLTNSSFRSMSLQPSTPFYIALCFRVSQLDFQLIACEEKWPIPQGKSWSLRLILPASCPNTNSTCNTSGH